jgi:hypothetical protein
VKEEGELVLKALPLSPEPKDREAGQGVGNLPAGRYRRTSHSTSTIISRLPAKTAAV